jgi:RimJ/RimL family protein N-acetyltransferase
MPALRRLSRLPGFGLTQKTGVMTIQTAGVYMLSAEHAEAIQRLASDPAIGATTRIPHPYPENGARDFIAALVRERADGTAHVFVIKDRQEIVGLCGLHGIEGAEARELGFWVGRPFWGSGYASFGVKMVLQFAFRNLRLERVGVCALESNAASRRVLEKNGFRLLRLERHNDPMLKRPDELLAQYEITRSQWQDFLNTHVLAALPPGLKTILEAEISAGNDRRDRQRVAGREQRVCAAAAAVPHTPVAIAGWSAIHRTERSHWWKAEFSSRSPGTSWPAERFK